MAATALEHGSRIGDLLLRSGLISEEQLGEAVDYQKQCGCRLGSALVALGAIEEKIIAAFLSMQRGMKAIHLAERTLSPETLAVLSPAVARRLGVVPVERSGDVLKVAMVDPGDVEVLRAVESETGLKVSGFIAPQSSIHAALKRFYPGDSEAGLRNTTDPRRIRARLAEARRALDAIERELNAS